MNASSPGKRNLPAIPRWAYTLIAVLLVGIPLGVNAARQLTPTSNSPATGHALVVTQGVAKINADRVVWRLVERTARPRWQATPARRALSFILASEEPVLLSNVTTKGLKDVARLAPGEAIMVTSDARTVRASFSDKSIKYLALELVPAADADDVGSGKLLFESRSFNSPNGERDIDLVRNVLTLGETATVPDTGQSNVVLATEGAIDVVPNNGRATRLETGESGTFRGDLKIKAVKPSGANTGAVSALTTYLAQDQTSRASYVVAVIGPEIPPPTSPTPTTTATATATVATNPNAPGSPIPTALPTLKPGAPTLTPTGFPIFIPPTDTPTPIPGLPTNTPIRPINTPVPPTPTDTPVPPLPTPTDTPVPPTEAPTNTAVPPSPTPTERRHPDLLDVDGDGLNLLQGIAYKTDTFDPDTDDDRDLDGEEVDCGSDPLDDMNRCDEIGGTGEQTPEPTATESGVL
jgi:hypothetical protein